ncbi:MAG: aryl-sulfate sulfotransferase, partial [Campylobacteraceae bacterium]|nr:aryl-sulfate sulfotransferase [Campylobacteraceae bacterium]
MSARKVLSSAIIAGLILSVSSAALFAAGGGSGTKTYKGEGKIGAVVMNPFDIAPLTAVIKSGGYKLTNVKVVVEGKEGGGLPISYGVSDNKVLLYGGIPVWGMYPDYQNRVNVSYALHNVNGSVQNVKETYTIYAPPVNLYGSGTKQKRVLPEAKVVIQADNSIKKDLYLMNHLSSTLPNAAQVIWNNPVGGAIEWDYETYVWIIDTNGDIRWYLDTSKLRDTN